MELRVKIQPSPITLPLSDRYSQYADNVLAALKVALKSVYDRKLSSSITVNNLAYIALSRFPDCRYKHDITTEIHTMYDMSYSLLIDNDNTTTSIHIVENTVTSICEVHVYEVKTTPYIQTHTYMLTITLTLIK